MIVKTYSYRYAEEILQHSSNIEIYNELMDIFKNCPLPVYKGKSKNQKSKDVVQQLMNTYFYEAFISKNWEPEPLASPENMDDSLRSDFRKTFKRKNGKNITIQIEVEFGNIASSYRNYFKFQLSFAYGLTDICVIVVPSARLANRIDSGVANFEKVKREIPSAKLSITGPILVIGLFDIDENRYSVPIWDIKEEKVDIKIAKNISREYNEEHHKLVKEYINGMRDLETKR